jgi:hypothetical protein
LVADDDDLVAPARDRGANIVRSRSGREPVVGLHCGIEGSRELTAGLAGPEQRARQDRSGPGSLGFELLPERAGLFAALRGQASELVGVSRRGLGVTDEVEAHCG